MGKDDKKGNTVSDFVSAMASDVKSAFSGPEARNYGDGYDYKTPKEKRTEDRKRAEANYELFHGDEDDKPQQRRPQAKPVPIKTVEDYYNLLKGPVEPLPSLLTPTSKTYSKPKYGDVSTRSSTKKKGEGVEARSFFQSMSTGYV
jgi:hypothetical protein